MSTLQELVTRARNAAEEVAKHPVDSDARFDAEGAHIEAAMQLGARHTEIQKLINATRTPKQALIYSLRPHVPVGGMLIYRGEHFWMCDAGPHTEPTVVEGLRATAASDTVDVLYEILADYRHVIIVRPRGAR